MLFTGRNLVKYDYSRYGYTRGGGKTWHGGLDIGGLDDANIRMPGYNGKSISGTVVTARIVTDKSNKTWEWGWYVCVKLDANQTPDAVNYLYFCHCSKLLVKVGQRVKTGDVLAIVGQTGNAAGTWTHCHLEVRATATGKGLDPTAYAGIHNKAGTYGTAPTTQTTTKLQTITIGPVSQGDADAVYAVCKQRGLTDAGLYKSVWVEA
nr:MAG TPA: peptidase [Caudoviricetes sp.]